MGTAHRRSTSIELEGHRSPSGRHRRVTSARDIACRDKRAHAVTDVHAAARKIGSASPGKRDELERLASNVNLRTQFEIENKQSNTNEV